MKPGQPFCVAFCDGRPVRGWLGGLDDDPLIKRRREMVAAPTLTRPTPGGTMPAPRRTAPSRPSRSAARTRPSSPSAAQRVQARAARDRAISAAVAAGQIPDTPIAVESWRTSFDRDPQRAKASLATFPAGAFKRPASRAAAQAASSPPARPAPASAPRASDVDERLIGAALSDGRILNVSVDAWRRAFATNAAAARAELEAIPRHRAGTPSSSATAGSGSGSRPGSLPRALRTTTSSADARQSCLGGERQR